MLPLLANDPIAAAFSQNSTLFNDSQRKLDHVIAANRPLPPRGHSRNSIRADDEFRVSKVEARRVVVKLEKELVVKIALTVSGPFGRLLRNMDELYPVESVPGTPSLTQPECRVGRDAILLTSSVQLPYTRNIDSERLWCFRSDAVPKAIDLTFPLIPDNVKRTASVDKRTLRLPYAVLVYRKIAHDKKTMHMTDVIELRSIGALGEADVEVFAEPMDRKTEMMDYAERIFLGGGVIRIVMSCSVSHGDLNFTKTTRHFWTSDLNRTEPFLNTARDCADTSIRVGTISDTSAGSPPSPNSPFSRMQRTTSMRNMTAQSTGLASSETRTANDEQTATSTTPTKRSSPK